MARAPAKFSDALCDAMAEDAAAVKHCRKPLGDSNQVPLDLDQCEDISDDRLDTSRYRSLLRALDDEHTLLLRKLQMQTGAFQSHAMATKLSRSTTSSLLSEHGALPQPLPTIGCSIMQQREGTDCSGLSDHILPPPGCPSRTASTVKRDEAVQRVFAYDASAKQDSVDVVAQPEHPSSDCEGEDGGGVTPDERAEWQSAPVEVVTHARTDVAQKAPPSDDVLARPRCATEPVVVGTARSDNKLAAHQPRVPSDALATTSSRHVVQQWNADPSSAVADVSAVMKMINANAAAQPVDRRTILGRYCGKIVHSQTFNMSIMALIFLHIVIMALEMQYVGTKSAMEAGIMEGGRALDSRFPYVEDALIVLEFFFTICFAVELLLRLVEGGCAGAIKFIKAPMNWVDIFVVLVGILGAVSSSNRDYPNPQIIRIVRVAKLFRGIRLVGFGAVMSSLHLLTKSLKASISVMGWSLMLLLVIQCIAAMVICQIVQLHIQDATRNLDSRKIVFDYYGTFSRAVVTMFEVTLGNWGPPCRILMENLHEAYASFFLVYRCFVGFAILNVITAVFVQQTTKCAQADQEVMIVAKQKEKQAYLAKLKQFFEALDVSGDGCISQDEFAEMLSRPEVELWLSTLEVNPTDVQLLFNLIDDGDGEISIDEFCFGISRLRGNARSVDIMEILMQLSKLEELVSCGFAGDLDSRRLPPLHRGLAFCSGMEPTRSRTRRDVGRTSEMDTTFSGARSSRRSQQKQRHLGGSILSEEGLLEGQNAGLNF